MRVLILLRVCLQVSLIHEQLIDSARKCSARAERSRSRSPPPDSAEKAKKKNCFCERERERERESKGGEREIERESESESEKGVARVAYSCSEPCLRVSMRSSIP